jgi:hypothetical protein
MHNQAAFQRFEGSDNFYARKLNDLLFNFQGRDIVDDRFGSTVRANIARPDHHGPGNEKARVTTSCVTRASNTAILRNSTIKGILITTPY